MCGSRCLAVGGCRCVVVGLWYYVCDSRCLVVGGGRCVV